MEPWRTGIVQASDGEIRIRGYDVLDLMRGATFTDTICLLHRGQLPTQAEREMLDALLIASADHGSNAPSCATARMAASGNRGSVSSAIAAGILAIGDQHGGAGSTCMELIASGVARAGNESVTVAEAARAIADEYQAGGQRLPGLGHRVHAKDPRTPVLFDMARARGFAGDGIAFMEAIEAVVRDTVKPLPINIDGSLAAVLYDMKFPAIFGRLLFIVGRVAGLSAEVSEELSRERAMRIRIAVTYDGEPPRSLD
ncbi:MAG: citryl-CoA lyase [Vicinamibacterales bacterium]